MKALNVLVENYRNATEGFNVLGKIVLAIVLAFIIISILFALVGVIMDLLQKGPSFL